MMTGRTPRWLTLLLPVLVMALAQGCPQQLPSIGKDEDSEKLDALSEAGEVASSCEGENPGCPDWDKGICKGKVAAACVQGAWACDPTAVEGYVKDDASCDGKDSDCDGIADDKEDFASAGVKVEDACGGEANEINGFKSVDNGACKALKAKVKFSCKKSGDEWAFSCDYSALLDEPTFVEDERFTPEWGMALCDGVDNDCDGDVDEHMEGRAGLDTANFEAAVFSTTCPLFTGLCTASVVEGDPQKAWEIVSDIAFKCDGGDPYCSLDVVTPLGYQDPEVVCDGKDNDCDGETDEVTDITESDCLFKGVCKDKTQAACLNGAWYCQLGDALNDPDFELGEETLCDGKDNDCDGLTDEGLQWPQHCFQGVDEGGNPVYDCTNEECSKFHPECQGATPLSFTDCPLLTSVTIAGKKIDYYPVLDNDGLPLLQGICERNPGTGETPVRNSCEPLDFVAGDGKIDGALWKCNFDAVADYVKPEKFVSGKPTWCDGKDNDCDGVVDGYQDKEGVHYITNSAEMSKTTCRYLGECAGNVKGECNAEGKNPGKWTCKYNLVPDKITEVPANCDPDAANCLWAETLCDGRDNDCDGMSDELLDGMKAELDTACQTEKDKGVCAEALDKLNTRCGTKPGGVKGFVCDLSQVPNYVADETKPEYCDSRDNDCDGKTDEDILLYTAPDILKYNAGCLTQGICIKGTLANCKPKAVPEPGKANWECDYGQVKDGSGNTFQTLNYLDPAKGVYREVMCNGLDDDCDGSVDEELDQDFGPLSDKQNPKVKSGCSFLGYCAGNMKWGCKNEGGQSKWFCDASGYTKYETPEKSCDGEDNDCDGSVDEELTDPGITGANCKSKGVCTEKVFAECLKGPPASWLCHYEALAPLYDGDDEKTCDGKDNDCDGLTDEELNEKKTWKDSGACTTVGVCSSPNLQAVCKPTGWECLYALLAPEGWESNEKLCDDQDNDCDGATDELACKYCEPCNDFTNCENAACMETPLGDKYCSLGKNYCVYVDPSDGLCTSVPAKTGKGCKDSTQPCLCGGGDGADAFWFCAGVPACSGATPICHKGECKTCVPGKKKCDGNTILECSTDGKVWKTYGLCGGTQICLGEGKCVSNDEAKVNVKAVSTSPGEFSPKIAGLVGGGFVVVYHANQPTGGALTDVLARMYDYQGKPLASEVIVNQPGVAGSQENPDVAAFPKTDGGFVVVWESSAEQGGDGWDIAAQRFLNNGLKQGEKFTVNTTTAMDQRGAEVAAFYDGSFLVAWEHNFSGADSPDVRAQLFNNKGEKAGPEKTLNSYLASQQRTVVVAALDKDGWVTAWASLGQVDNNDIISRRYNSTLAELGGEAQVNMATLSAQKRPAIGGFLGTNKGEYAIAWESYGQDTPTTQGVFAQVFTSGGLAKQPTDVLCNSKYVAGNQDDPELAVFEDSSFVVVWESSDVPLDGEGDAVMAKVFDKSGNAIVADEVMVNQTVAGQQNNPAVTTLEGRGYGVVWTNQLTAGGTTTTDVYVRLFKAP